MPIGSRSARRTFVALVDIVRDYADAEGLEFLSRSWSTRDGRVTIDYVPSLMVRVTFTGDALARSYVLPADWRG